MQKTPAKSQKSTKLKTPNSSKSNWTVKQLKQALEDYKLSKTGNKRDLLERLEAHLNEKDSSDSEDSLSEKEVSSDSEIEKEESNEKPSYSGWKVSQLQAELKRRNIPVSATTKQKLMEKLVENDGSLGEPVDFRKRGNVTKSLDLEAQTEVASKQQRSKRRSKDADVKINLADVTARSQDLVDRREEEMTFFKSPVKIIQYFVLEIGDFLFKAMAYFFSHRVLVSVLLILLGLFFVGVSVESPYQETLKSWESSTLWYSYWVVLGIASSIGLGTGLHTFLLFLGPFIAKVTVFAFECGTLDFDIRGDDSFMCDSNISDVHLPLLGLFSKVAFESFAWGAGTAIGELPPYFVARAAALAGREDEEFDHIEEIKNKLPSTLTFMEKLQLFMFALMQKMGFWGILLSASIPNPLFDLAGITCGHFLIPFSTFFGATFIGKAIVKSSIQTFFVILMFSKDSIDKILEFLQRNNVGLYKMVVKFLDEQKHKFTNVGDHGESSSSLVSTIWNGFIGLMISYFLLSIVKSLAVARLKRELSSTNSPKKPAKRNKSPSKLDKRV